MLNTTRYGLFKSLDNEEYDLDFMVEWLWERLSVKEEYKGYHGLYLDIRYTVNLKGS